MRRPSPAGLGVFWLWAAFSLASSVWSPGPLEAQDLPPELKETLKDFCRNNRRILPPAGICGCSYPGTCGKQALAGCFCSPDCIQKGDCCPDACLVCGACR
jgi:hypothetical protein